MKVKDKKGYEFDVDVLDIISQLEAGLRKKEGIPEHAVLRYEGRDKFSWVSSEKAGVSCSVFCEATHKQMALKATFRDLRDLVKKGQRLKDMDW